MCAFTHTVVAYSVNSLNGIITLRRCVSSFTLLLLLLLLLLVGLFYPTTVKSRKNFVYSSRRTEVTVFLAAGSLDRRAFALGKESFVSVVLPL